MPNTRLVFTAEPEALRDGIWTTCAPHCAQRWAVYRIRQMTAKRGQSRPRPIRKLIAKFFGAGAEARARACVGQHAVHSKPFRRIQLKRGARCRSFDEGDY